MKAHTNNFKTDITKLGKEIDAKITYQLNGQTIELGAEQLNSVVPHFESSILKSTMKQLDLDSNVDIPLNTILNAQFGLKVNGAYEYLNYGNYVVYSSEKKEDTDSYSIICYDKMLYSMIDYEDLGITYPITIRDYLIAICTHLGLSFKNANDTFANYNREIEKELYLDSNGGSLGYTFRDVLDQLAQATASTICINDDTDELEIRYITDTTLETQEVEGTSISIPNADSGNINSLELKGNTTQETTNGNQLVDFNNLTTSNATYTFTNDVLTINATGYDHNRVEYDITDVVKNNPGKTLKFGYSSVDFSNFTSDNNTLVQLQIITSSSTFKTLATKSGNSISKTNYAIPSDTSDIRYVYAVFFASASASSNNDSILKLTNPLIYLDNNDTYEPFTNGKSPNPDYPQNIDVVTGGQNIEVRGSRNICPTNFNDWEKGHYDGDGMKATSTYRIRVKRLIPVQPNTTYYFDTFTSNPTYKLIIRTYNQNQTFNTNIGAVNNKATKTFDANTYYISISLYNATSETSTDYEMFETLFENGTIKPLICLNSETDKSYEAYKGKSYEINLGKNLINVTETNKGTSSSGVISSPNTIYLGIDDYVEVEPNTTYSITFQHDVSSANLYVSSKDANGTFISRDTQLTKRTFTTGATTHYIFFYLNKSGVTFETIGGYVQLEKNIVPTPYSLYKTPIELCKIDTYQDSIKKAIGKNLFDKSKSEFSSAYTTLTELETGVRATLSRTGTNRYSSIKLDGDALLGKTITVSATITPSGTNNGLVRIFFTSGNSLTTKIGNNISATGSLSYTIPSSYSNNDDGIAIVFSSNNNGTASVGDYVDYTNVQVEIGETATSYEPYGTGWYIEKQIGKVVLDGSENWTQQTTSTTGLYRHNLTYNDLKTGYKNAISNYFIISNETSFANINSVCFTTHPSNHQFSFFDNETSVNNWKSWLSTHNTIAYYVLATPTYTFIEDEELISQLEGVRLLEGLNNIIVSSSDLSSPIKINYISLIDTIDEEYFKDTNVNFGEKYGPVNSIVLSRSESDNVYLQDEQSIAQNGLCEIKISENQIMNWNDRADYLPNILNKLDGLEYYINDFTSTGIMYYDLCDRYFAKIGDIKYKCILFNDEKVIENGLEENIHTDMPEETETDYKKADKTDRKINQTSLIVDKQNQTIEALITETTDGDNPNSLTSRISQTAKSISLSVTDNQTSAGLTIKLYNEDGSEIDSQSGNITLSGLVKFTDLSGSGTTTINGANITTGSINADRIGGGTLTINTSGGGYLSAGANTTHVNVSGLNVTGGAGININNLGFNSNGSTFTFAGGINTPFITATSDLEVDRDAIVYGVFKTNQIKPGGYLQISTGGRTGYGDNPGSIYLYASAHITLNAAYDHYVYIGNANVGNARAATSSSGPSSRCLKTNIEEFKQSEYNDALTLLDEIKLYDYNYKYNIHPKKDQFGFMIDDLLENKLANKFFYFKDEKAGINENNYLDYLAGEENSKNLPIINFKRYDEETLIKYLLVVCKALQQKINKLEEK